MMFLFVSVLSLNFLLRRRSPLPIFTTDFSVCMEKCACVLDFSVYMEKCAWVLVVLDNE